MNVVTELSVPASELKSDGDPTTIEIVFLTKKSDGRAGSRMMAR
jgi:hypothetical protein